MVKAKPSRKTSYKFATIKREAQKRAETREAENPRPVIPPFVLDDVQPPIVITAPDTVERQLMIGEYVGMDGMFNYGNSLGLLRAICGDQFPRVWMMVKDDKNPETLIGLIQTMLDHFAGYISDLTEAAELPGGSEDSLN